MSGTLGLLFGFQSPATPRADLVATPSFPPFSVSASMSALPPGLTAIYGTSNVLNWREGEDMVFNGSNVLAAWPDKVAGVALNSIVGSPPVTPSNAALGNLPTVLFDGTSQYLTMPISRPAPATEPTAIIMIAKQVTTASGRHFYGTATNTLALTQTAISPQVLQRNTSGGNINSGWALSAWKLIIVYYTGSTADYSKVGSASAVTGTSAGNTTPGTNLYIGARPTSNFSNYELYSFAMLKVDPMSQFSALVSYYNSKLPSSVTT